MKFKLLSQLALSLAIASPLIGDDIKSPLESLPAHTIAAVSIDNSKEQQDAFVSNTKLGQLLMSPERIAGYKTHIEHLLETENDLKNAIGHIEEIGLSIEDIYSMLSSKIGMAITERRGANNEPFPIFYLWAEMADGMAEKAFTTLLETSGESEDLIREDLEISGILTTRIREKQGGSSAVFARLQNRFIFMIGSLTEHSDPNQAEFYEDAEIEELGTFINAQLGEGGEFLENFYATPGIGEHIPETDPGLQVMGDISKLISFLSPKQLPLLNGLELNTLTKFGLWSSFNDKLQTANFFIGSPSPRKGVMAMIDQTPIHFETPNWVPTEATAYSVTSLNIEGLYDIALSTAANFFPQELINQQLGQIEEQLQASLQTDIATLLASFGKRLYTLDFPINFVDTGTQNGPSTIPQESKAIILDLESTDLFAKALEMATPMASQQPGIETFDEQGFQGIRFSMTGVVTTISYGKNKFIFTQGEGTASRVFSLLNTPPEGVQALENDAVFRQATEQYTPEKGLSFTYANGDKLIKSLMPLFSWMTESAIQNSGNKKEQIEEILSLLPSQEDFESILGTIITRTYSTEDGLNGSTIYEYK